MNSSNLAYHNLKSGQLTACQLCGFKELGVVLDLGQQPLSDSLLTKEQLGRPEKTYPLKFCWCPQCFLAQIDYCVAPEIIYHAGYPYRSGATKELVEYFAGFAASLISQYRLTAESLVVDIGSNDGTLLSKFRQQGIKVVGVEPTGAANDAAASGIPTMQKFFDASVAKEIVKQYGQATLVTCCMVLERAASLNEVLAGAELLLKDGGALVIETHYLLNIIEGGQFDAIYHEHLRTFTLTTLIKLFEHYNFTIVDAEMGFANRGNLKIYAVKGKGQKPSSNVAKFLAAEKKAGLENLQTYLQFAERVKKSKQAFIKLMSEIKDAGATVAANSCPARCATLLNYYGAGVDWLPFIAEHPTSFKLGMYLPGQHIPIVSNQKLLDEQPKYVVLLAWYYAEAIMKALKQRGLKSDFIIPLPDLQIIKNFQV